MAPRKKDVEDFYPLSPLQQGMLFHTLEDPTSGIYSEQVSCRLRGELDEGALERAWQRVVERHPVLRTAFVWQGVKEPVQVVYRRLAMPLEKLDWRSLPAAESRRRLQAFLEQDQRRGFDLTRPPLLRLTLVRTAEEVRYLVWGHHHILLDGWSVPLLLEEVFALYEAFRAGRDLEMPRPRPYRDFIAWLRRRDRSADERFWRRVLAGFREPTELRLGTPGPDHAGMGEKRVHLSPEVSSAIEGSARRRRLTLNTLVQGAWSLLLSRYSGRRDVLFGTTVSGRPPELEGIESMVGLFINTLPVRREVSGRAPVLPWLRGLQEQLAELRQFEPTALLDVQGWSESGQGRPLFDNLLVFENYPVSPAAGREGSLGIEDVRYRERTSYPLTVVAGKVAAGKVPELLIRLVYDRRRFGDAAVSRLLGHLVNALAGLAEAPQRRLAQIELLSPAERQQLVQERQEVPSGRTLDQLFARQVAERPNAVALVLAGDPRKAGAADRCLTYGELGALVRRLAGELRRRGVGPEVRVGLCLDRSPETVVAILAVLEAGGAYVPLDPGYPAERLAFLLADSRVALLVTREALRDRLPDAAGLRMLDLDGPGAGGAHHDGRPGGAGPDNLAYVIYTSGSTGRPKGTLVSHRNVVRLLAATEPWFRFGPDDVWTLFHSYAFDFSVWELWGALAYGGRLVVVPYSVSRSPSEMLALLDRERVTVLNQTPSAFYQLLRAEEESGETAGPALNRVIFGGEALSPTLLAPWFEREGRRGELVNMYGITETTVHVTYRPLRAADAAAGESPVGRPIPDLEIHLLDSDLGPVPLEVTGEVHVGGAGLARGYLDRPALTAERFVPHPAGAAAGGRLYRTGDEARRRPDGDLDFLGRLDRQVQVRGFRVEPGEIECALLGHGRVREAVVVARSLEKAISGVELVAYVAGRPPVPEKTDLSTELRSFLRERLPEHMVPSHLVVLEEFPLTVHGKLDRSALPEPERKGVGLTVPATPLEELLAEIWAEVLGLERVGVDESFFDLGGHSLLATRVVSKVRKVLGREVPLHTLFEAPTVALLATALESEQRTAAPTLTRQPRRGELPLSFSQERLWFLDRLDPGNPVYNLSFAVRLEGDLEPERLRLGLSRVVARHEILRTTFAEVDGRPVQVIAPGGEAALPEVDLTGLLCPEVVARELSEREARAPFDLAAGPVVRARLLKLGAGERVLLLTLHHIVADAWSMSVLVAEVAEVYRGEEAALPALPLQYADFVLWQRQWLAGEELERQLEFWRRRLADAPEGLELPTDRPRPALQSFRGSQLERALPPELSARLGELGRRSGVTLFMTLLAAFQTLLSRITGRADMLVGVPVAGRNHAELEGMVGFFVHTLVLRGDLGGDPSFSELLGRARAATLEAYAHQDLPFARLVAELQPDRDLSQQPLFQVAFALQNAPPIRFELPGVDQRPFQVPNTVSRFDLTVSWEPVPEGLVAALEYNTDLFDATTAVRLLRHQENVLKGAADDPSRPLSRLGVLVGAERQQLLQENDDTTVSYLEAAPLHRLIAARAARAPDAVAVVFDGDGEVRQLTRRELDRRSRRLAGRLSALGAGRGSRVGVALERSVELVVALVGTLSAGAAYVPLDPEYPAERLAFMLDDAGISVLLVRGGLPRGLEPPPSVAVLELGAAAVEEEPAASPGTGLGDLAYVLYTSGSTGTPKGVMVPHEGIVNRLLGMREAYGLGPGDRVLQKTPTSFDVSGWEFFLPLVTGARLVLARPGGHRDGLYLARLLAREAITILHFVPSMLHAFLEAVAPEGRCPSPARVIASGEALSAELAERFHQRFDAELHNLYGPTEASIDVAAWRCRPGARTVPIGRSVSNTVLRLLDRRLEPVPLGVAGELLIGGTQLARGYRGRPALTAEKFVPDPLGEEPGRLYKTGDLARRRPGGEIEFLGRRDHQVKIRGFRIEPGEVEATLERHPAVAVSVVVARRSGAGDTRLVAYAVPDGAAAPAARRWLALAPRDRLLYELPNGWTVAHLNRGETEFLYREVVADETYFRHGIDVKAGDVVFDVGANIGLFSLFAASRAPGSKLYAVEPIPRIAEALRLNVEAHGLEAEVLECALADRPGRAELTFYPHVSLISGRFGDAEAEREVVRTFLAREDEAAELDPEEVEELLDERLAAESVSCRLATLSRLMAEHGVERIDLLKIDAEKSELEVLAGIEDADWPGIRQVVVEVHDVEGRLARVRAMLEGRGYRVAEEQDTMLAGGGLYNLYARRPEAEAARVTAREAPPWRGPQRLAADLREFLRERLPEHLVPGALVLLDALPRTPSGKLDRAALPEPEVWDRGRTAPRGPEETTLAEIWRDLLGVRKVAVEDSFFDLGGHSLLATRMLARVRGAFAVEVSLRSFFEGPTLGALAREVAAGRGTAVDPIVPFDRSGGGELPLSVGQERLWFLDRLEGGNAAYNVPLPVVLRGELRPGILAAALTEVLRRHEVLRTTFEEVGGRPRGVAAAPGKAEIPLLDLSALQPSEARREAELLARDDARLPFDLARGPLLRPALVRLRADHHLLLVTLHHIVADAWSMGLLVRELTTLYDAFRRGASSPLDELPVQYADFAHWQRHRPDLEEQLAWWRDRLTGAPAAPGLVSDRPRPTAPTFRGGQCSRLVPQGLDRRLEDLGRRSGATPFMTLLAAFEVLLYRYSGQADQVVGTPVANRPRPELEGLIGFFLNTLVLRTDLAGRPSFREVLRRVRDNALAAYARQDLPFERLVAELDPQRDLARNPLFQVMFVLQNAPLPSLELGGLAVEPFRIEAGTAKFDLMVGFTPGSRALEASVEYSTDLFDATTAVRLIEHLFTLLAAVAEDPRRPVAALPLLTPAERFHALTEWNAEAAVSGRPALVHRLFETRAATAPEAVALLFEGRHRSYRRLDRDAAALAGRLRRLGVGPEVPVALCLERSPEMVAALLAVLKAGGACLPLDPAYPEERLRFMLDDARVPVLLTTGEAGGALAQRHPGHTLLLEHEALGTGTEEVSAESGVEPGNPAYLIYTSGSTGRPKAVAMPHSALVNLLRWQEETATPGGPLRTPQFAALSFDVSFQETFATLHAGGTLLVLREETRRDPKATLELLARERLERLFLPFLALRQLAEVAGEHRLFPRGLRHVTTAGEALRVTAAVVELFRRLDGAVLHNQYGPSETHVVSGLALRGSPGDWPALPAIGRPIAATALYVLDGAGQPLPVGAPGELAIGGIMVARGYLRRPGLTAGRFGPDAFGGAPGRRLYRSGDLARRRTDGNVAFLGRLDGQVKIRGYRVEPGEIEAALARHPNVREAVVDLAGREALGNRRLVAYVTTAPEAAAPSGRELRELLRRSLPEYMIPADFRTPAAFPLTPSGKVDRRALRAQEAGRLDSGTAYAAPATALEERLADLWAQVLGRERVGVHDDFFDLGGHSLLAVQLLSRIRDTLGVELPLRQLFEAPTVAAAAVEVAARAEGEAAGMPPVVPVNRDGELPLSLPQERLWFLDQLEPGSTAYNLPAAVRFRGELRVDVFAAALGEVARRHEALRTTFESTAGRPRQVIHPAPADPREALPLPLIDLTALDPAARGPEAERRVGQEAAAPFDLGRGPLVRARLLRVTAREWVFVLHFHHIASDGWSMEVLARELAALYAAFAGGRTSPLPALPVQYADYAHWQREWLEGGDVLAAQVSYWRERLGDSPAPLELPTPRPRPAVQTYRGAAQTRILPRELAEELRALGRREGATRFMTLLAGFKALLARYTGQRDILVGAPAAGRGRREVEGLIGYFLNTLVLRTDLAGNPAFREVLRRVRGSALGAFQHQDVPFEKLLEELQPARDSSRTPFFQVLFTMLDFGGTQGLALELPGVSVEPVPLPAPGAKFDLTLYAGEVEGGLELRLVYNRDLFEPEQMVLLLEHLERLLAGAAENPDTRLADLPLGPAQPGAARRERAAPPHSVAERFLQAVERHGGEVAISSDRFRWTYGELAARAAGVRRALGMYRDERVALLFEHDAPMVAALLGVLGSGAAYVPLDPVSPRQRLARILEDARPAAILADGPNRALAEELRELSGTGIPRLDFEELDPGEAGKLAAVSPGAPAYLLYTSGSTGRPKGVVQSHRNVLHHAGTYADVLGVGPGDRLSLFSSYTFDASVMDLYGALLHGAALFPKDVRREGVEDLGAWVSARRITVYHSTPTLYRALMAGLIGGEDFSPLRWIVLGGEAVRRRDFELYRRHFPDHVRLLNGLGPTESTLALQYFADRGTELVRETLPVGAPVRDMEARLFHETGEQAALYGVGEIVLRSPYLALGYWRRPEETRAAFGMEGEVRTYRTGDLGRLLPGGVLEYAGRKDLQVKVRGHRVEPGEVESVLGSHPAVAEAAVVARSEGETGARLLAYVVASEVRVAELRKYLSERLPGYMIPAAIVVLDEMPQTATGKVDRRRLPEPPAGRADPAAPQVAPRTEVESRVAEVWQEVLGLEEVSVDDDFFGLGGHSLLATQVVARLRRLFDVELPLRDLFEQPTVSRLAEAIETARSRPPAGPPAVPRLRAVPRAGRRVRRSRLGRDTGPAPPAPTLPLQAEDVPAGGEMAFSLFFFSADGSGDARDKYRLLEASARFADREGFAAVWTPERHFNAFGGLYPNPALTSAALARVTERIELRAGSVVLPLQNPLRVAEEWAVVDNLSGGRVAVAFASGWHVNDFVLAPDRYERRREVMAEGIDVVRRLWRGEAVSLPNGAGQEVEVRVFPRPLQPELPVWLTCQSESTFERAGEMGFHVLTNMNYKSVEALEERVTLYREARRKAGHDPAAGRVTLMVHTFITADPPALRDELRSAYGGYLLTNLALQMRLAEGFGVSAELSDADREFLMDQAFERLLASHGLVGTPKQCREKAARFRAAGVDEIACLIDFGLPFEKVMAGLDLLARTKAEVARQPGLAAVGSP